MSDSATPGVSRVEAKPSNDPAVRLLIVAVMAIGMGAYCLYHAYLSGDPKYTQPPAASFSEDINANSTYYFNLIGGYVLPLVGLPFLVGAIRQKRRTLVLDDSGITSGRQQIAWSSVRDIDATQLAKKGILNVYHADGKLKLDSYQWQKGDFAQVVAKLEQHVPAEKIKR